MSSTFREHQTGPRRRLIDQIADLTDTQEDSIRKKKLSAEQAWTVYEELTGNKRDVVKGRGWAIKKILEHLDILEYKSYTNNVRISVDGLEEVRNALKNGDGGED